MPKLKLESANGKALSPIIITNGPPGSGKDEAYIQADTVLDAILFSTSESLKLATLAAFGLQEMEITVEEMERTKNEANPLLDGLTWREAQIRVAENLKAEAAFGPQFWTRSLIRKIKAMDKIIAEDKNRRAVFFVTGMGFPIEMNLFETDPELNERSLLLRVKRDSKTYGKKPGYEDAYGPSTGFDSRNFLFSDSIQSAELDNNLGKVEYRHDLLMTLHRFFPIGKYAMERNDRIVNTAILSKKLKNERTGDIVPFAKPYRVFNPGEIVDRREQSATA